MKTIEEVKAERSYGDVYTREDFERLVRVGWFVPSDGSGRYHDGENETNISVWDKSLTSNKIKKYPYVRWYNK